MLEHLHKGGFAKGGRDEFVRHAAHVLPTGPQRFQPLLRRNVGGLHLHFEGEKMVADAVVQLAGQARVLLLQLCEILAGQRLLGFVLRLLKFVLPLFGFPAQALVAQLLPLQQIGGSGAQQQEEGQRGAHPQLQPALGFAFLLLKALDFQLLLLRFIFHGQFLKLAALLGTVERVVQRRGLAERLIGIAIVAAVAIDSMKVVVDIIKHKGILADAVGLQQPAGGADGTVIPAGGLLQIKTDLQIANDGHDRLHLRHQRLGLAQGSLHLSLWTPRAEEHQQIVGLGAQGRVILPEPVGQPHCRLQIAERTVVVLPHDENGGGHGEELRAEQAVGAALGRLRGFAGIAFSLVTVLHVEIESGQVDIERSCRLEFLLGVKRQVTAKGQSLVVGLHRLVRTPRRAEINAL